MCVRHQQKKPFHRIEILEFKKIQKNDEKCFRKRKMISIFSCHDREKRIDRYSKRRQFKKNCNVQKTNQNDEKKTPEHRKKLNS